MQLSSLAVQLEMERQRHFVGRASESELFRTTVTAEQLPFYLLHVVGHSGVGKTTLLGEFVRICQQLQIPFVHLDASQVEPVPDAVLQALKLNRERGNTARARLGVPEDHTLLFEDRTVLFIDTYDLLEEIDPWVRTTLLPQLPANTLIVLAGCRPLATAWRVDAGWQSLIRTLPLRNFSLQESHEYVHTRQIPIAQRQAVLDFSNGHPLALALIADIFDQNRSLDFQPQAMPDLIKPLLERFIKQVPSPVHRMALEACSIVYQITEALLAEMLDRVDQQGALSPGTVSLEQPVNPSAHELFAWLRGLSFIESGRLGLFPHEMAREVLICDLRWRNPDWFTELHLRACKYCLRSLEHSQGKDYQRIWLDYVFLHRHHMAIRTRFTWQQTHDMSTDTLRSSDYPALLQMVTNHEGEDSAKLAAYWFSRQPEGVKVLRDVTQQPVGFWMTLALHQATEEDVAMDPATLAAWQYLNQSAPLRSGERATIIRFWMAQETYQAVSSVQSLIFINLAQQYHTTAGLAFMFFPCADPNFWAVVAEYANLVRIPATDFQIGGRFYGVYGCDRRRKSLSCWQTQRTRQELPQAIPTALDALEPVEILSRERFEVAVHEALRHFDNPNKLVQNPLLRSQLVLGKATHPINPAERATTLKTLIKQAIDSLQTSPRTLKFYRVLYRTYLHPAASQELAAELLDLPFGTYRRHLKSGIIELVERLWQQEIA